MSELFAGAIWQRGARLGLIWLAVFFGVTLVVWALMGALGWSGAARAMCAMGLGPVLGTGVIVFWWMTRRPDLTGPTEES